MLQGLPVSLLLVIFSMLWSFHYACDVFLIIVMAYMVINAEMFKFPQVCFIGYNLDTMGFLFIFYHC